MTEERIERFSDHAWSIWEKAWTTWDEASSKADPECNTKAVIIISENLSAIAAEARKEGLEEGRDIAIAAFEIDIDSTVWDLNRIRVFIREAIAERLKEGR